ncbi:MAG: hypothetical protein Q9218_004048 [Villophora microphyllina]
MQLRKTIIDENPHKWELNLRSHASNVKLVDYPSHKARTPTTIERIRAAGKHLDEFWANFERDLVSKFGKTLPQLKGTILGHRQVLRTAPWVEHSSPSSHTGEDKVVPMALKLAHATLEERTQRTIAQDPGTQPRIKIKTRNTPSATGQAHIQREQIPTTEALSKQQTIVVRNTVLKVFSSLFRTFPPRFFWESSLGRFWCTP